MGFIRTLIHGDCDIRNERLKNDLVEFREAGYRAVARIEELEKERDDLASKLGIEVGSNKRLHKEVHELKGVYDYSMHDKETWVSILQGRLDKILNAYKQNSDFTDIMSLGAKYYPLLDALTEAVKEQPCKVNPDLMGKKCGDAIIIDSTEPKKAIEKMKSAKVNVIVPNPAIVEFSKKDKYAHMKKGK
jgi:predicted nuclease with TOPRIM domain